MIKWDDKYVLGIDEIDKQHQHLFEVTAKVAELTEDIGQGIDCYDEFMEILKELVDYTLYHFNFEEQFMTSKGYDEDAYQIHQFEHKLFVKKLKKLSEIDFDEDQYENMNNMLTFLVDWIVHHILVVDAKYVNIA
ncbi:hemerythrin family protein [Vallitalea pronyensis]|uniref:Hemerythrin family protein n=1 Tax=Vallitalea pronyensis TaxID=1348613 RepID=A0A8J8SIQ8_9FIRM|nr:bacteriohemerythrin [Vallitalea pronyensis]QUI24702.1 hemerythrin family protein [Vallitalea pronyensis]